MVLVVFAAMNGIHMSLSEYLNELAQAEHESAQDREMYGDDDR